MFIVSEKINSSQEQERGQYSYHSVNWKGQKAKLETLIDAHYLGFCISIGAM